MRNNKSAERQDKSRKEEAAKRLYTSVGWSCASTVFEVICVEQFCVCFVFVCVVNSVLMISCTGL